MLTFVLFIYLVGYVATAYLLVGHCKSMRDKFMLLFILAFVWGMYLLMYIDLMYIEPWRAGVLERRRA